jgi:mono/diheme cytochrome c family protein
MSLPLTARAIGAMTALAVVGCVAVEALAPPVTPTMASAARVPASDLEGGRQIYVRRCATCHAIDPVNKYSGARWREIIDDMATKSKLASEEKARVLAYVLAASRGAVAE